MPTNAGDSFQFKVSDLYFGQGVGVLQETYLYNSNGTMSQKADRNGVITTYTYDIHNRLTVENVGGEVHEYTYDSNGNQLSMIDSTGTTVRTYDPLNRVLTKIVPGLGTTHFAYNITSGLPEGHVGSSTTDHKNNTVTRINDKAGRLYQVKDGSVITATYTYYDNGNLQKLQYPGSSEEYTYHANNRLNTLVNKQGSTIIDAYSYGYDAAGNQTRKVDGKGITDYTYDQLHRLSTVVEQGGKQTSYTYDAAGNREEETVTIGSVSIATTYTYNEQNRLLHTEKTLTAGVIERVDYTYDNNGNMLSQIESIIRDDDALFPPNSL